MSAAKIAKAKREVSRLFDVEREFADQLERRLGEAEAATGGDVGADLLAAALADGAGIDNQLAAAGDKAVRLTGQIKGLQSAIAAARRTRRATVLQLWKMEAEELQAQAATKRSEADRHNAKTQGLLRQLADQEGLAFGPLPIPGTATRGMQMLAEVQELEHRAAKLAARKVQESGALSVDGPVTAIEGALASRATQMAPPIPDVRRWAQKASESVRRDAAVRAHRPLSADEVDQLVYRFSLVWTDGVIDEARSSVTGIPIPEAVAS